MTDQLFVYGTLRKDAPDGRSSLLGPGAEFVGYARMKGRLLDLGHFPGFLPPDDGPERGGSGLTEGAEEEASWVRGELYALRNPGATLSRLDRYEGCGPNDPEPHLFERMERKALLEDGARIRAWVYAYRGPTREAVEISSGDYLDRVG